MTSGRSAGDCNHAVCKGEESEESWEQVTACPAFRGQNLSRHVGMCLHIEREIPAMQSAVCTQNIYPECREATLFVW